MTDEAFLAAFESCQLPNEAFRHRQHLRLAWLYLRRGPYDQAADAMERSIRRFAARHGAPTKYHHTLTLVWMRLVAAAADDAPTFDAFLVAHPELLDKTAPARFYSAARLASEEARVSWLDPDVCPLPHLPTDASGQYDGVKEDACPDRDPRHSV